MGRSAEGWAVWAEGTSAAPESHGGKDARVATHVCVPEQVPSSHKARAAKPNQRVGARTWFSLLSSATGAGNAVFSGSVGPDGSGEDLPCPGQGGDRASVLTAPARTRGRLCTPCTRSQSQEAC